MTNGIEYEMINGRETFNESIGNYEDQIRKLKKIDMKEKKEAFNAKEADQSFVLKDSFNKCSCSTPSSGGLSLFPSSGLCVNSGRLCSSLRENKKRKNIFFLEMDKKKKGSIYHMIEIYSIMLNYTVKAMDFLSFRKTLGPLLLLTIGPCIAISLLMIIKEYNGNFSAAMDACMNEGIEKCIIEKLPSFKNKKAWMIICIFMSVGMILTRFLPCKMFLGPPSPTGYRNKYHNNGIQYWLIMNILFIIGSKEIGILNLFTLGIIYDNYNDIVLSLCIVAIVLCIFLYMKGLYYPSSKDSGATGNIIFDFFYGTELHPNVLGWDIKQFTNDRFGMTWWGIACVSFCAKQYELYGYLSDTILLSVTLQLVYITKFFVWEDGYFCSLDIQHDRAGFYICWGCLVWIPSVYTSSAYYLTTHPLNIGFINFFFLFIGLFMIFVNYDADRQRQMFRQTNGQVKIWGRIPCKINAVYKNQHGEVKQALLLASGWWGIARHFHYLPEIIAALCWTPPVHSQSVLPYLYTFYLIILLVDRAFRDDIRCYNKYGAYWIEYCKLVPYKIIPHVL